MSANGTGERMVLVLSGGHALGAFQAGAYEALEAGGWRPDWVLGTSIGAVNGAVICGNEPELRSARLRQFWSEASGPDLSGWGEMPLPQTSLGIMAGLRSFFLGRPPLFLPNWLLTGAGAPHLFDRSPMPGLLERVIDFERLSRAQPPLTLNTTDVESGEEALFDTRRDRLDARHFLATTAFLPDFEAIRIEGRLLCDGSFSLNAPLDALFDPEPGPLQVILIDLYDPIGAAPNTMGAALRRRDELMFGVPIRRALSGWQRIYRERPVRSAIRLLRIAYPSSPEEPPLKIYDYSRTTTGRRWQLGGSAGERALELLARLPEPSPGLHILDLGP